LEHVSSLVRERGVPRLLTWSTGTRPADVGAEVTEPMTIVAGLFSDPDRATRAIDELRAASFQEDQVTVVASPSSAAELVRVTSTELPTPGGGFVDLGAAMGGQADPAFPDEEARLYEERVAQGDVLVRVDAPDDNTADHAKAILRENGADRVSPGIIED
jgi:hypothetical protein